MKNCIVHFALSIFIIMTSSQVAMTQTKNDNVFTFHTGEYEVSLLSEGQGSGKPGILIDASPEILKECIPNGTFPNATNAFLIRTPNKKILVDAGLGNNLTGNLQHLGVTAGQIDIILITHMHGDHIGGLLREGKATFPNATIRLSRPEFEYWTNEEIMKQLPENRQGGFRKAIEVANAYKDKITLFQPDELDAKLNLLLPGIYAIATYGHTPGHTAFLLESGKEKLLIWGDLTHAMAVQMPHPEISVTYDSDPEQAAATRKKILEYASKNNIPIAGMHIAYPAVGKVSEKGSGYTFTPTSIK